MKTRIEYRTNSTIVYHSTTSRAISVAGIQNREAISGIVQTIPPKTHGRRIKIVAALREAGMVAH